MQAHVASTMIGQSKRYKDIDSCIHSYIDVYIYIIYDLSMGFIDQPSKMQMSVDTRPVELRNKKNVQV